MPAVFVNALQTSGLSMCKHIIVHNFRCYINTRKPVLVFVEFFQCILPSVVVLWRFGERRFLCPVLYVRAWPSLYAKTMRKWEVYAAKWHVEILEQLNTARSFKRSTSFRRTGACRQRLGLRISWEKIQRKKRGPVGKGVGRLSCTNSGAKDKQQYGYKCNVSGAQSPSPWLNGANGI